MSDHLTPRRSYPAAVWRGRYPVVLLPGPIRSFTQLEYGRRWLESAGGEDQPAVVFVPDRSDLTGASAAALVFGSDFVERATANATSRLGPRRVLVATRRRLRSHRRAWPSSPTLALWPSTDDLRVIDHCIRPTSLAIAVGDVAALADWIETRAAVPSFAPDARNG